MHGGLTRQKNFFQLGISALNVDMTTSVRKRISWMYGSILVLLGLASWK